MSMLSSQIDKLRELAADADVYGDTRHLSDPLRDAADTIWQLRDDLQRANAAVQDAEHDESMAWDRVRKAEAENGKLREYAKLMHDHIKECCDCCDEWYCSEWDEDNECCRFDTMMRACGIEVPS